MTKELFTLPPVGEGAGAYVDEVIESLNHWVNTPSHATQEYDFLCELRDFLGEYFERESAGQA
jgi:hypothetical protein